MKGSICFHNALSGGNLRKQALEFVFEPILLPETARDYAVYFSKRTHHDPGEVKWTNC